MVNKKTNNKTKFLLQLDKTDLNQLKKIAESKGLNTSALIRMIVKEYLVK